MATTQNFAIVSGRVGGSPEIRYLQDGTAVANFSVATSKEWKTDGEKKQKTVWVRVNMWGKQAEGLTPYIHKGDFVTVHGTIEEPSAYIDKATGEARATAQIRMAEFFFMPGNNRNGEDAGETESTPAPAAEGVLDF